MRVLRIDQRDAVRGLAGLKQQRILAAGVGRGLQAEHSPQHDASVAERNEPRQAFPS